MATPYTADFTAQGIRDRKRGNAAENRYIKYLHGFDANKAAYDASMAQYGDIMKALTRGVGDLRGSQVGSGRLTSGFGAGDERRFVQQGRDQLTRDIARNSLQAQGLNLSAENALGQTGMGMTNRYLDILAGNRDAALAEEERKRREKNALWGTLAKEGGTIAAAALL